MATKTDGKKKQRYKLSKKTVYTVCAQIGITRDLRGE